MDSNLSYPNIHFTETIIGPPPVTRQWRSKIGIAGAFNKGPKEATTITSRQQFVALYGEDNSPGSLAVQQAMELGATEFIIASALPESSSAAFNISFASGNPDLEPTIGYESSTNSTSLTLDSTNRTIGLSLEANYVGSPLSPKSVYSALSTANTKINHANFNGRANINVYVVKHVDGGSQTNPVYAPNTWSLSGVFAAGTPGDIQIIAVNKDPLVNPDLTNILPYLEPGMVLKNANVEVIVLSVFSMNDEAYGVLVQNVSASTAIEETDLQVKYPSVGHYILGYQIASQDAVSISPLLPNGSYFTLPNASFNDGYSTYSVDSFFAIPSTGVPNNTINFAYQVASTSSVNAGLLTQETFGNAADEGVRITFGSASDNKIALLPKGHFLVPIAKTSVTVGSTQYDSSAAYQAGTTGFQIIKDLESAIYADTTFSALVSEVSSYLTVPPYNLYLTTRQRGVESNRIFLTLNRHTTALTPESCLDLLVKVQNDLSYGLSSYGRTVKFQGAVNGPTPAFKDFYAVNGTPLLRVVAISPGTGGNQIRVSITPNNISAESATYTLRVEDTNKVSTDPSTGNAQVETFVLDNKQIDYRTGIYLQTVNSAVIRAYFLPIAEPAADVTGVSDETYRLIPLRQAPPLGRTNISLNTGATAVASVGGVYTKNINLSGGTDYSPSSISNTEAIRLGYLSALDKLNKEDVAILLIAGLDFGNSFYSSVFQKAKNQVEQSTPNNGLRIAVFEAPASMSANQALSLSDQIDSSRVVLLRGDVVMASSTGNVAANVSSSGYYAGVLSVRPPFASPASTYGEVIPQGVIAVDTENSSQYLDVATRGRMELMFYDSNKRAFKFLNGVSTSRDPRYRYISIRRIMDHIISDLNNYLQWALSEQNTRELQQRIASSVDAYLANKLREGYLNRYAPTICGPENNTQTDMINGRLNIRIRVTPNFPVNYIKVGVVQDLTEDFSLNLN